MKTAGSNQNSALVKAVAVLGFLNFKLRIGIKAVGEGFGETGRHVLNNGNTRHTGRQAFQQQADGFGASGGGAQYNDLFRIANARLQRAALQLIVGFGFGLNHLGVRKSTRLTSGNAGTPMPASAWKKKINTTCNS